MKALLVFFLLCLYIALGLVGYARAGCEDIPVTVYVVVVHSANMNLWVLDGQTAHNTLEQCTRVALPHERCIALTGTMPPNAPVGQP